MSKLFHKDKPIIGLDISATSIKIMSVDINKWAVKGCRRKKNFFNKRESKKTAFDKKDKRRN